MKDKNKKGLIWLVIMLIVVTLIILYLLFGRQKTNYTKTYSLKKLVDLDDKINYVEFLKSIDDYTVLGYHSKEKNKSVNKLLILNNNNKIYESIENGINNIKDTNIFYTNNKIINYKNPNAVANSYDEVKVHNNIFIVKKNGLYGLADSEGKNITEITYDNIESRNVLSNYLFAIKSNKVGIINTKGEIIVPIEYDIKEVEYEMEYKDYGQIITSNKSYFILSKNNKNYVFNESKNIILDSNEKIYYDYNLDYFYTINGEKYSFYNTNGEYLKDVNINSAWGKNNVHHINSETKSNFIIFQDKKTIYELNKDLKLKSYDNIYFVEEEGMDDNYNNYYFNNDIYIVKNNDKYELFSKNNDKLLGKYSTLKYISSSDYEDEDNIMNIFIACKNENECGVLDLTGKETTDFKYKYIPNLEYIRDGYGILQNDKENILISINDQIETVTCTTNNIDDSNIRATYKKIYITEKDIYNNNCEKINEKPIRNYKYLENKYLIAEINDECSFGDETKCNYYIWDDNNLINYANNDNAKIYLYLGFANNKLFFKTDKGIYYIDMK